MTRPVLADPQNFAIACKYALYLIIAHHQDPEGNQPRRQRIRLFIDEQRPLTLRISRGGRIAAPQAPAVQGRGDMMDLDE